MKLDAFLERWEGSEGSERSNSQHFLIDLCDLVGLPRPGTKDGDDFRFEQRAKFKAADGDHTGRADLVRRGAFVIECKQFTKKERASKAWNLGMQDALGQALDYANGLDQLPVFVIACDVGHCFELLACFDGSGVYRPFPAGANRIYLRDLRKPERFDDLKQALVEPAAANPARLQLEITTDVAEKIGVLAKQLRAAGHDREVVARFLLRCLFTMFAEDVALFENGRRVFEELLRDHWIKDPSRFVHGVSLLWQTMNTGGYSERGEVIQKFNGGLFRDYTALPLTKEQLQLLYEAARKNWSKVEPAIFGTLLENALGEKERHELGAHFTPKAYVERLVRPTIEEPLRAEWLVVRAQVRDLMEAAEGTDKTGKTPKAEKDALATLKAFHQRLCKIKVLDPACGTGNFLYVAMELMKVLEAEVLEEIRRVGGVSQENLELSEFTVQPKNFLGIEKNPWAKEIAELVLWIGYLRWQWQLRGSTKSLQVGDSILRDEKNIECRDAVLDWDGAPAERMKLDDRGKPVTRWDGETTKLDPLTGQQIPDDSPKGRKPVYEYPNARKASWPDADFIVGNPPFIGTRRMRLTLGDGYVQALATAWHEVPENADLVMYWWAAAAEQVRAGRSQTFGLITTNSITQAFNRATIRTQLAAKPPLAITLAIPDHPWVDASEGAAVRVAMTVGRRGPAQGRVMSLTAETPTAAESGLSFVEAFGTVSEDLRVGASPAAARPLRANAELAYWGVKSTATAS
ncbi:MAG: class I SAM-dependent DNA methyltransferase [Deltaproteobacteria bacterium]|nr:class I SAM-dependent DNA methyltransferase [Deltaproteobacteria bacterium]